MGRKPRDISGQRFGRIVAISPISTSGDEMIWDCVCDCGTQKQIGLNTLVSGNTNSCGCLRKERARLLAPSANKAAADIRRQPYGQSSMNSLYEKYNRTAKIRGYEFDLTKDDFKKLTSSNCFYCNKKPSQIAKYTNQFGEYVYNGIDRVDNGIGYTIENCVACCGICNRAKDIMSVHEFHEWIISVYTNLGSTK